MNDERRFTVLGGVIAGSFFLAGLYLVHNFMIRGADRGASSVVVFLASLSFSALGCWLAMKMERRRWLGQPVSLEMIPIGDYQNLGTLGSVAVLEHSTDSESDFCLPRRYCVSLEVGRNLPSYFKHVGKGQVQSYQ